ncbi:MAG TPA: caspase family protein, partial [Dongiaceae bacterium]|nr:caspase family protein [Dongiaceae bacterium]
MMGRIGRAFVLLSIALCLVLPGDAWAATRVALVVGNGAYAPEIGKLKNPRNDAQLMAETLQGLGFEVALVLDADQKAMKRAVREFGQKLRESGPQGIGLFYYAGHGVQVDGENYLLPIGAEVAAEGDVELEAVAAAGILSQMQYAGNAVNLAFLDACRNNPLTRSFRSGARGLARVDAPRGSFVGYSTAPGDVSVDGDADNSPYALALAEELNTPGISIEEAHRAVRGKVLAATNQRQTPWDSSSLTGPVILKEEKPTQEPQVAAVTPTAPAPSPAA